MGISSHGCVADHDIDLEMNDELPLSPPDNPAPAYHEHGEPQQTSQQSGTCQRSHNPQPGLGQGAQSVRHQPIQTTESEAPEPQNHQYDGYQAAPVRNQDEPQVPNPTPPTQATTTIGGHGPASHPQEAAAQATPIWGHNRLATAALLGGIGYYFPDPISNSLALFPSEDAPNQLLDDQDYIPYSSALKDLYDQGEDNFLGEGAFIQAGEVPEQWSADQQEPIFENPPSQARKKTKRENKKTTEEEKQGAKEKKKREAEQKEMRVEAKKHKKEEKQKRVAEKKKKVEERRNVTEKNMKGKENDTGSEEPQQSVYGGQV